MVEIKIDNTGDGTWWLYNSNQGWKDYCGCENFDEQVVLTGNRDFTGCMEAEWYQKANELLDDIANDFDALDICDDYSLTQEQYKTAKEMYDKCRCTEDILIDVIRLLYPKDTFKTGTIRGYNQGDWQDYIVMGDVDTDLLEEIGHNHSLVVTLEDGIVDGGFGHKIAAFYSASNVKVKNYGLEKKFYDRYNPAELLKELGMTNEAMVNDIKELLVEIN